MIRLRANRLHSSEKGAHIVELALTLPLYFLLILVMVDLARIVTTYTSLSMATRKASREGAVPDIREIIPGALTGGPRAEFAQISLLYGGFPGVTERDATGGFFDEPHVMVNGAGDPDFYGAFATAARSFEGETRSPLPSNALYRAEARAIAIANVTLRESLGKWSYPCIIGFPSCPNDANQWMCFTIRGSNSYAQGMQNTLGVTGIKLLGIRCDAYIQTYSSILMFGFGPSYFRLTSTSTENVGFLPDWMFNVN